MKDSSPPVFTSPGVWWKSWTSAGLPARLALRGLTRSPGTSLLAALVLTLGLAAPVTFFSLLVGAIRPLPVPQGERVVRFEVVQTTTGGGSVPITLSDLESLQGSASLTSVGGYRLVGGTLVDVGRAAVRVAGARLTPEVLPLLRIDPVLGRVPDREEADVGILLGYGLWQESYGGDKAVLGRSVRFNEEVRTITGVLPEGFGFPFKQNLWLILGDDPSDNDPVELVGRLADGSSLAQATSELSGRWLQEDPVRDPALRGGVLEVKSYTGGRGESGEGIAFLGLVLVGLALLIIACANVANLLLVRASERIRTLGVQSALGAGRVHLSAQLFFEALILALGGGAGGLFLAWMGVGTIQRSMAAEHFGYFWMRMAVDGRVMAFSFFLMGGIAVVAGTLPILRVLRTDLQGVLKEGPADAKVAGGDFWSRWFVTIQLGLSCAALVAAGLTGTSLAQSSDFGSGVLADEVLVASLNPMGEVDSAVEGWGARIRALTDALSSVVGAEQSALALGAPGYIEPRGPVELEGDEAQRALDRRNVGWNAVSSGFFSLFDLEIVQGRGLRPSDDGNERAVAVVNQAFVANNYPGGDPLGQRLRVFEADTAAFFTIVGVVENVELGGGPSSPEERVYLSLQQVTQPTVMALLRSRTGGGPAPSAVGSTLAGVDPGIPVFWVRTLADAHDYMTRVPRAMASIALAGGLGGLLVAAVGLYALLAFRVRQRRRELGVRLALGADGRVLAREVLRVAFRQLIPAMVFGLAVAWLLAPILGAVIMSSDPRSPGTFLGVAGSFLAVGMVAALIPSLRAAAVDPAQVLRGE